jgi:hypothetical protein
MTPFTLILKHFWLIALIVMFVNWLKFRIKAQKQIKKQPGLKKGYESLLQGYLLFMGLPYLVMGIGCTLGGVPSVFHYFRPRDGNPYVLAWFGCVFLHLVGFTFWLFFKNGAEKLVQYPGAIEIHNGFQSTDVTNPELIKLIWLLGLAGALIAAAIIWSTDIPIQKITITR